MPDTDAPTQAEVIRRLERIETQLDNYRQDMESKFVARVVATDVYQAEKLALQVQLSNLTRDVSKLEDARTALQRLVATALVGVVVNVIMMVFQQGAK